MRNLGLAFAFMLVLAVQVTAQKFGYLNSNELLTALPEVATAEEQLTQLQNELETEGQTMLSAFETNYQQYMNEVNEGLLSKMEMAEREQKLTVDQQAIAQFEQTAQQRLLAKRQEVLEPILNRVDEAIQTYGKENGYTFIFDTSTPGALLHYPEGDNILDAIKAKLGGQ